MVTINNKTLFYRNWINVGLIFIRDLFDDSGFLMIVVFENIYISVLIKLKVMQKPKTEECNCRRKEDCTVVGKCLFEGVI